MCLCARFIRSLQCLTPDTLFAARHHAKSRGLFTPLVPCSRLPREDSSAEPPLLSAPKLPILSEAVHLFMDAVHYLSHHKVPTNSPRFKKLSLRDVACILLLSICAKLPGVSRHSAASGAADITGAQAASVDRQTIARIRSNGQSAAHFLFPPSNGLAAPRNTFT